LGAAKTNASAATVRKKSTGINLLKNLSGRIIVRKKRKIPNSIRTRCLEDEDSRAVFIFALLTAKKLMVSKAI